MSHALEATLERLLSPGRWPQLPKHLDALARYLDPKVAADPTQLQGLQLEELHLCCRCVADDPVALEIFDREFIQRVDPALRSFRLSPAQLLEVRQSVRARLLLPTAGRARLTEFAGRGSLLGFVRAAAARLAMDLVRARDSNADDDGLLEIPDLAPDPEMAALKRQARGEFREALQQALSSLEPRQRTLLKQFFVDGLTNEQIAELYGVHRTTSFRWIASARRTVAKRAKVELAARLGLSPEQLHELSFYVRSQLSLSLTRLLS